MYFADEGRKTTSACKPYVPWYKDPVCGSDGVTYLNIYVLEDVSCRKGLGLKLKAKGACSAECQTMDVSEMQCP
jgi:hypothetical protein